MEKLGESSNLLQTDLQIYIVLETNVNKQSCFDKLSELIDKRKHNLWQNNLHNLIVFQS